MARRKFTSETAAAAGRKSKRKGRHKKSVQWENMRTYMLGDGAKRAKEIMKKCSDKEFIENFNKMIEYFEPKLNRTTLEHENDQELVIRYENHWQEKLNGNNTTDTTSRATNGTIES